MKKEVIVLTIMLLLGISLLYPLSLVSGQLGINIYLVTPTGGVAGQGVNVQGTIDTTNGTYELYMGARLLVTDKSEGYYVNANFSVPELPAGDYTLILRDVAKKQNATKTFTLRMGYNIAAIMPSAPAHLQEGDSVVLNVTLTGAKSGTAYSANITVELPEPLKTEYSRLITLTPASQTGTARAEVIFPSVEFQPSGSLTNYTGTYTAYFNKTILLASSQFFIAFTNASQYHRGESVSIRAIGYGAGQTATVKIVNQKTGSNVYTANVVASSEGVITSVWAVPSNAALGTYQATITPEGIAKEVVDSQEFNVPGYPVQIRTLSLGGAMVRGVVVEAVDLATKEVYSGTSGYGGIATINLEKGGANITAYWNEVQVGGISLTITKEDQHDLVCSLVNLKILVKDGHGFLTPFVSLNITYSYTTTKQGSLRTDSVSGQTDISGTYILYFVLPGIDYKISASLYRVVFNSGNNTFASIPAVPTHEIVIVIPSHSLSLTILDYNLKGLPEARIALSEQTSGAFYANSTDRAGRVSAEVAFGKYRLRIYKDNLLLNETIVEVFGNTEGEIQCVLYNLRVSVLVVDFLGQPIPKMIVDFRGPDQVTRSNITLEDGTTTFSNVIGGAAQLVAHQGNSENYCEALNLRVDSPAAVQIRLGKYILLWGYLVDAGMFLAMLIVLSAIVVLAMFELQRRKKSNLPASKTKEIPSQK